MDRPLYDRRRGGGLGGLVAGVLDRVLYRRPFEGASARRYATAERPAFEALDDRLLAHPALAAPLARARRLLEVGAGPGTFARRAAAAHPHLRVLALEPSAAFPRYAPPVVELRARAEALPLPRGSIDVAVCLSSLRHVQDRARALAELRRVVTDRLVVVELDPAATPAQIAAHADRLGSAVLRRAFGPLVVRTAPPAAHIVALAAGAGFRLVRHDVDAVQPVYILELA